jgi:hypothetical protein
MPEDDGGSLPSPTKKPPPAMPHVVAPKDNPIKTKKIKIKKAPKYK